MSDHTIGAARRAHRTAIEEINKAIWHYDQLNVPRTTADHLVTVRDQLTIILNNAPTQETTA